MNRTKQIEYNLITWNDADIPELIRDCSFAGKYIPKSQNNETEQITKTSEVPLINKKKRASKKSIVPSVTNENNDECSSILSSLEISNNPNLKKSNENPSDKLSNHFSFGNGSSHSDAFMNKTSNNKLDQSLRISYAEMSDTLKSFKPKYLNSIELLNKTYENNYFKEWFKLMNAGFNLLLHGVGSKKCLIRKFCDTYLNESYYIELLGYHHDLNAKNLLKSILADVLELTDTYKSFDEQINAINQNLSNELYLIIHNIDGNCLRDHSIQYCLSELANNKRIHFLASVDHINSTLLWDNMQFISFKWIHYETNTLIPYNDEIMFENSLMLNQTGNVQLSSIIHILKSLTQNAKSIFLTMVEHVLNPENIKKNITFTKLYHECREKFFVSNELTLRAQLTEFIDHKLIKIKTENDGYETIYLLIDDQNLKIYLDELKDKV